MSTQTAELLQAFEALPDPEKRAFTAAFLKRAIPFESDSLDDAEIAQSTDELMSMLDADERNSGTR